MTLIFSQKKMEKDGELLEVKEVSLGLVLIPPHTCFHWLWFDISLSNWKIQLDDRTTVKKDSQHVPILQQKVSRQAAQWYADAAEHSAWSTQWDYSDVLHTISYLSHLGKAREEVTTKSKLMTRGANRREWTLFVCIESYGMPVCGESVCIKKTLSSSACTLLHRLGIGECKKKNPREEIHTQKLIKTGREETTETPYNS